MATRVAQLRVDRAKLAELIGLAPGDSVVGAHLDPMGEGAIVLMVSGERFPEAAPTDTRFGTALLPQTVSITFTKGEVETLPVRRIHASYGGEKWSLTRAEIVDGSGAAVASSGKD